MQHDKIVAITATAETDATTALSLVLFLGSAGELRLDPIEGLHQPQSAASSRSAPQGHGADVGGLGAHGLGDVLEERQPLLGLRHDDRRSPATPPQQQQQHR